MTYTRAFFPGVGLDVVQHFDFLNEEKVERREGYDSKKYRKKFLEYFDFLDKEKVYILDEEKDVRIEGWECYQYRTCDEPGIRAKMYKYKPKDAYAMLAITNHDLYPQPSWSFCFGWAMYV